VVNCGILDRFHNKLLLACRDLPMSFPWPFLLYIFDILSDLSDPLVQKFILALSAFWVDRLA